MKRLICVFLCVALCFGWALAEESENELTLEMLDGSTVKLSDYEGYVSILFMWATWCPNCVAELPVIQQLHEAYPDTVRVLAVNQGEDRETIEDFLADTEYTFPIALDPYGIMLSYVFPSDYLPYLAMLDEEGHMIYEKIGGGQDLFGELSAIMDIHHAFQTADAYSPDETEEGETVRTAGTVAGESESGFILLLEDGSQLICGWPGQMPEEGTAVEAVGIFTAGKLELQGLKRASHAE